MTALRQEALQIVNDMPDNLMAALLQYLKNFKPEKKNSIDDLEIDSEKEAAIKAIKEWQDLNRAILESNIDWDKEIESAMEEKYGPFI